ncbi:MAG: sigma-70 family RNA polymerase sigma factor [Clostridiales bacterium]|jgi:RNA polymerase sigma-70 factor (ECF subfamily)|nr:sigma-70 family RNA polymerase sigma factor [Clostridiales bacterium]
MLLFSVITETERERLGTLIVAVANGDGDSLAQIYEAAGGRLLSVAMGYTRNLFLAEDVLQDSFISIARHCHQFKKGTNGYAWLCTVVRNTALNALKYEGRRQGADIDSFFALSDGVDRFGTFENSHLVEKAMRALDKEERTAIWLKYFNEMTVREVAAELNKSKSTVHELIIRAENKMRAVMSENNV